MTQPKKKSVPENDEARRKEIISAALECFLKFGYSKTALDDIAKTARISRPLLYLKYKNKEDIFKAVFLDIISDGYEAAEQIVKSSKNKDKKANLLALYEALLLKPWEKIIGHPMSEEFYVTCDRLFPEVGGQHEKILLKSVISIIGNKDLAEVFSLAVVGMHQDLPPAKELRRRLKVLIDRFV